MHNITFVEGSPEEVTVKFKPHVLNNLWATMSINLNPGHVRLSTADEEIEVDGHLETIKFFMPEIPAGTYEYTLVVGDPYDIVAMITGVVTVEEKPKAKAKTRKAKPKKEEPVIEEVEIKEEGRTLFTSETFPLEGESNESTSGVEVPGLSDDSG